MRHGSTKHRLIEREGEERGEGEIACSCVSCTQKSYRLRPADAAHRRWARFSGAIYWLSAGEKRNCYVIGAALEALAFGRRLMSVLLTVCKAPVRSALYVGRSVGRSRTAAFIHRWYSVILCRRPFYLCVVCVNWHISVLHFAGGLRAPTD